METLFSPALRLSRRPRWGAALIVGLALLLASCVTDTQVRSIVTASNAALLASQFGELPARTTGDASANWEAANAQIEAFIAAHPDQASTLAPLRIRQAMLLLGHRQLNLARAAFDAAPAAALHTARDKALKAQAPHLLWWFGASAADTWTAGDQSAAREARAALQTACDELAASPEIRDYLAEISAWIGYAAARQATTAEERRTRLETALRDYAQIFSASDRALLSAGLDQPRPDLHAATTELRRCLRARVILREAGAYDRANQVGVHLADPTFQALLAAE